MAFGQPGMLLGRLGKRVGKNNEPPDEIVGVCPSVEKLLHGRYTVVGNAENERFSDIDAVIDMKPRVGGAW